MCTRILVLLTVLFAAVFLAPGCGSGDRSGGDTTTASISKAEFIKRVDSICTQVGKRTENEFAAFSKENHIPEGKEPTAAQYGEIGKQILIPALQQQVEKIRALGVPENDQDRISRFLDAVDNAIEKAENEPETAGKSPTTLLAGADRIINNYGFKVCGQ